MEYVAERGSFDNLLLEQIKTNFAQLDLQWSPGVAPVSADSETGADRNNSR